MSPNLQRAALHLAALAAMAYGYNTLVALIHGSQAGDWMLGQRGGLFQFLTICGLALAWVTCLVALVHSLVPSFTAIGNLKSALGLVALPVSIIVTEVYWPLILLAPSLIAEVDLGPGVDGMPPPAAFMYPLPIPLDLALHAAPALALLVDFFAFEHRYSRWQALNAGFPLSVFTGVAYGTWTEYCASANRTFPYPFLNVALPIRIAIYAAATAIAYASFLFVNSLHPIPNPSESKTKVYYDDDDAVWPELGPWVWFGRIKL
ncbi:hypothetical protein EXIGLDRAFT_839341 [Exidia glandulosa HHB12029]|uniref:FAR-17a/AIG1-like protein n=1 Tax=Exidia glandulosa HHB12029 TaxID=1314781 RepID=A0A165F3L3_EXIGL|nr:hypothetical protein EXIGLDRAFT_839341 [Exidia glandulosa HHB12029]